MSELFDLPESLSPRLRWMREHDVQTRFESHPVTAEWQRWIAWIPQRESLRGWGATEEDAVRELAEIHGYANYQKL